MRDAADQATVAIVGINYPPERTGIAPYTGAMARALARRGCDVHVVTAQPHYPEWHVYDGYRRWRSDSVDERVGVRRLLHYVPGHPHGIERLVSEMSLGVRMALDGSWRHRDALVLVSPAMFSSAMVSAWARLWAPRMEQVVWIQDLYGRGWTENGGGGAIARIIHTVEGRLLRRADRLVVIHERFKKVVCEEYGVDPDRIEVVRNWTHLASHAPIDRPSARAELGWGSETVLLHAGNMGVKQGLDHVIEAARVAAERGERLRFVLVGDGSERESLEALAAGLENVDFLDSLDDEAYRRALVAADVLLVHEKPGIAEMAVPSKLTSYFDAARPVLAVTDPMGITAEEVRTAGAGDVVPSGDPSALVDAALELARDQLRAVRLGAAGRAHREAVLSEGAAVERFAGVLGLDPVEEPVVRRAPKAA